MTGVQTCALPIYEAKIKAATKKTNIALYQQRQIEKRDVDDKLKLATQKEKQASSPEEKAKSAEEVKKLRDSQKSKADMVKAAQKQVQSSN